MGRNPTPMVVMAEAALAHVSEETADEPVANRVMALRVLREHVEAAIADAVGEAREAGESWRTIGTALDVTKQSAWRQYASLSQVEADPAGYRVD